MNYFLFGVLLMPMMALCFYSGVFISKAMEDIFGASMGTVVLSTILSMVVGYFIGMEYAKYILIPLLQGAQG